MKNLKNILITGASSGLGAALALEYAEQGVSLLLLGRDRDRLANVAGAARAKGAYVETVIIDVTDKTAMKSAIEEYDASRPLGLVIANAGISGGENQDAEKIFAVNLGGVLNTIHPAISLMQKRKKGQIAIISSIASFRGLPSAPAYSASKAAVRFYGEALRGTLKNAGIKVTVICPGFIKTPMTDVNDFPMPMIMSAEKAARKIKRRLTRNPARIAFPWPLYFLMNFIGFLPPLLTDRMFSGLPGKK